MRLPFLTTGPTTAILALCGVLGCQSPWRACFNESECVVGMQGALMCGACGDVQGLLQEANLLEEEGNERAIDLYYAAANQSYTCLTVSNSPSDIANYHTALDGLLRAGQSFRRLDARSGLRIGSGPNATIVPVMHVGFPWAPCDFEAVVPSPEIESSELHREYGQYGIGLPVVVRRQFANNVEAQQRHLPPQTAFAATVVLKPCASSNAPAVLEFHDPLRVDRVSCSGRELPLARNLSSPLAVTLETASRTYLTGFLQPDAPGQEPVLRFLEPYQPGKIPVVAIHGVYSDSFSWSDLVNDLRGTPGITDRYQFWFFRYPTGQGFLRSAAALRQQLHQAVQACDPQGQDPALRQMVLMGHSMGGLVAKLQVTYSEEHIWCRLANRPLEQIVASPQTKMMLAQTCYFDPMPGVKRVIFIATPHQGSSFADGIGRAASALVRVGDGDRERHDQLMQDNPCVFSEEVQKRFPTSVDLLEPESPLLAAMQEMRISPNVKLHSIIGTSKPYGLEGPSDGVVPVSSAWHPCCESVIEVKSSHTKISHQPETSAEIARILRQHLSSPGDIRIGY